MRFASVVVAMGLGGCLKPAAFQCTADTDCAVGGSRCEVNGFCSFQDSTCPSGARFGEHSGPVANQCVGVASTDAGVDVPVVGDDGPVDAFVLGAWGTPVELTSLDSTGDDDSDPSLTGDGLEIFFSSDRSGGDGGFDIYRATRANLASPFGAPSLVGELSTASNEFSPEISDDGLTIYFTSNQSGGFQVFTATRPDRTSMFTGIAVEPNLSSGNDDFTVGISTDALVAVVSQAVGGAAGRENFQHTRANTGLPFGSGVAMTTINENANDVGATLAENGLSIVFHSDRGQGANAFKLYTATRASTGVDFPTPSVITELDGGGIESNAFVSADNRRMVFARDAGNDRQLFETTR